VKFTESLENPRGMASALACPANQTVHAHELFGFRLAYHNLAAPLPGKTCIQGSLESVSRWIKIAD
jgi:hypothetical protein